MKKINKRHLIKRLTKSNPKNEKLLETLYIVKNQYQDGIIYYVTNDNQEKIANAIYFYGNKYITKISVEKAFSRQGVATWLYNNIEKDLGIKLEPSRVLFPDGELFWENRLKQNKRNPLTNLSTLKKNPYRSKTLDNKNLTTNEMEYKHGYLRSLYIHLDFLLKLPEKRFLKYRDNSPTESKFGRSYYLDGWTEGRDDAYIQYKNIPKNKLSDYIVDIKNELVDFEKEHPVLDFISGPF